MMHAGLDLSRRKIVCRRLRNAGASRHGRLVALLL